METPKSSEFKAILASAELTEEFTQALIRIRRLPVGKRSGSYLSVTGQTIRISMDRKAMPKKNSLWGWLWE